MSNLLVQNIKHTNNTTSMAIDSSGQVSVRGESSATTTSLQQGLAKAWVNFDGTGTIAIRDDNNVSSLTDNNTGNYTINLTNSFSDTNYNATGLTGTGGALMNISVNTTVTMTSSAFSVFTGLSYNSSTGDCDFVYLTFHGDLA
tara:strand:- start:33 stop:464 length:432 start_codon:yes stop_codon:yes gene_type:complete